jgi:hypothetical protein
VNTTSRSSAFQDSPSRQQSVISAPDWRVAGVFFGSCSVTRFLIEVQPHPLDGPVDVADFGSQIAGEGLHPRADHGRRGGLPLLRLTIVGSLFGDALLRGDHLGVVGRLVFPQTKLAAPPGFSKRNRIAEQPLAKNLDRKRTGQTTFSRLAGNDGSHLRTKCREGFQQTFLSFAKTQENRLRRFSHAKPGRVSTLVNLAFEPPNHDLFDAFLLGRF